MAKGFSREVMKGKTGKDIKSKEALKVVTTAIAVAAKGEHGTKLFGG